MGKTKTKKKGERKKGEEQRNGEERKKGDKRKVYKNHKKLSNIYFKQIFNKLRNIEIIKN